MANYVADLQPELEVNYCRLVVVWTDDPPSTRAARQKLAATFPFLCDHERKVIAELDIIDTTGFGLRRTAEELHKDLDFVKDKSEWKDTDIVFEIANKGDKTEIRFTHVGLVPAYECYGVCSDAWGCPYQKCIRHMK